MFIFCSMMSTNIISIHALLAESDGGCCYLDNLEISISIHALLAESDKKYSKSKKQYIYFYPRSPCGERQDTPLISIPKPGFLSTLSLRRATKVWFL